jgi:hypothetical protein
MNHDDMGNPLGWSGAFSMGEADRQFAESIGSQYPEHAWVLSDRDVWYANPFYKGPRVPHPESDEAAARAAGWPDDEQPALAILDDYGQWVPFEQFAMRAPYFDVDGLEG